MPRTFGVASPALIASNKSTHTQKRLARAKSKKRQKKQKVCFSNNNTIKVVEGIFDYHPDENDPSFMHGGIFPNENEDANSFMAEVEAAKEEIEDLKMQIEIEETKLQKSINRKKQSPASNLEALLLGNDESTFSSPSSVLERSCDSTESSASRVVAVTVSSPLDSETSEVVSSSGSASAAVPMRSLARGDRRVLAASAAVTENGTKESTRTAGTA